MEKKGQFKPGQVANPGGRPKMPPEEREAWRVLAKKARDKLDAMLENGDVQPMFVAKVVELASDRAWGKPQQAVELSGDSDSPIDIRVTFE
jgi:hypothetical protein